MAKETMQAVSEVEKTARETILRARQDREQIISDAKEQGKKLLADAQKEALKKSEILCGVAKADGEKLKAKMQEDTRQEQDALKQAATAAFPQTAEEIKKLLLGRPERR